MTHLNKFVATTTERWGAGGGGWMQVTPELMPVLGFLLLQDYSG